MYVRRGGLHEDHNKRQDQNKAVRRNFLLQSLPLFQLQCTDEISRSLHATALWTVPTRGSQSCKHAPNQRMHDVLGVATRGGT